MAGRDFPARHVWRVPWIPWIPVLCVRPLKGNLQSHPGQQGLGVLQTWLAGSPLVDWKRNEAFFLNKHEVDMILLKVISWDISHYMLLMFQFE